MRQYAGGRAPHEDRPWVMLNMVTSVDGAVSVEGRSGGLAGDADREVFHALRTFPDVILVGSGTVRAEGYGPPRASPADSAMREAHDAWPVARIAIVTGSASLDYGSALFSEPTSRPLLVTTANAPADRIAQAAEVADVAVAGEDSVDVSRALSALGELGARVVLCEGGPNLNGQLLAADVVDELCLTVSPLLVAGSGKRIVTGDALETPFGLELVHVLEDDGSLFLRYRRPAD
ncbi:MAG: pyrimidine reductase family protein [Acidimicrobiia bacterium]|nr:pyrimidine reductase family protein [Acidimicrobiia bacterium]